MFEYLTNEKTPDLIKSQFQLKLNKTKINDENYL